MPIFEYVCQGCGHKFEAIVLGSKQAECPQCHDTQLKQQLSVFAVSKGAAPAMACASGSSCCMPEGGACEAAGAGCCDLN